MASLPLFESVQLGPHTLRNRMVMAPLTRSRATAEGAPTELMEIYYAQRATAGLIISEGVVISPQGVAYPNVPGIYSPGQVAAWRRVAEAVHRAGGKIFAQLWHVGRQSHSSVQPEGRLPVAPSPVRIENYRYYRRPEKLDYEIPRELEAREIREIIGQYAAAAENALAAGFDGVELHGANGYLIDQFLNSSSNRRGDRYGGSVTARMRFLHEVLEAVGEKVPLDRVGVRLSPSSTWMDAIDEDPRGLYLRVVNSLNTYHLAYLHLVEPEIAGSTTVEADPDAVPSAVFSAEFSGRVILTGGQDLFSAQRNLREGVADLIGFGRSFIANPDLPARLQTGAALNTPNPRTFYSGGATGYLTYPSLADEARWERLRARLDGGDPALDDVIGVFSSLSRTELHHSGDLYSSFRLQALREEALQNTY